MTTPNKKTASATGAEGKGEETLRRVPAKKVAQLKRKMDGAEKRMIRLYAKLLKIRAIIRQGTSEKYGSDGTVVGRNELSTEHIYGKRLERTQTEKELAVVKGEFLKNRREYRSVVTNNIQIERRSVQTIREENKIQRESSKLLRKTKEILLQHSLKGGKKEFEQLRSLAIQGDVKAFRSGFNQTMENFDPAHHTTISGVSQVKTEIIHSVMEELAQEGQKSVDSLTSAVNGETSNNK